MPEARARRVRRTKTQWVEIIRRFETSGLGSRKFCRRNGLALSSLQRWRGRLGSMSRTAFVELVPEGPSSDPAPSWSLEVSLPSGVCLRFRG